MIGRLVSLGLQYAIVESGELWVLTFTSDDLPAQQAFADAVAVTFTPNGG